MAVLSREDYISRISGMVGDTPEDLQLLEDLTDTYDSRENLAAENATLRGQVADITKKYKERFGAPVGNKKENPDPDDDPDFPKKRSFESLFKKGE